MRALISFTHRIRHLASRSDIRRRRLVFEGNTKTLIYTVTIAFLISVSSPFATYGWTYSCGYHTTRSFGTSYQLTIESVAIYLQTDTLNALLFSRTPSHSQRQELKPRVHQKGAKVKPQPPACAKVKPSQYSTLIGL